MLGYYLRSLMITAYLRSGVGAVVALTLGTAGLAGCGLISSDVTNFDLTLPDKKFTVDASGWQVDSAQADAYLAMDCSDRPNVCSTAVQLACTMNCSGTCNAAYTCDLSLDISRSQAVDLVSEKPELKAINDEPLIEVTVDSVSYEITSNTLTVDTPELTVYVAPISTVSVDRFDSQIKAIGTIPAIPAGQVTAHTEQLRFTPTGRAELVNIMSTFKTPFNVLVGSSIVITRGQAMPTGKLEAVVHIAGHAGL
jgi:hypothetical protein